MIPRTTRNKHDDHNDDHHKHKKLLPTQQQLRHKIPVVTKTTPDVIKSKIRHIQSQRDCERHRFADQQGYLANRQYFCQQKLHRLQQPRISIPRLYIQVINEISLGGGGSGNHHPNSQNKIIPASSYVLTREAELCHALHGIEMQKHQLKLIVKQQLLLEEMLQDRLEEEMELTDVMEKRLLTLIHYLSSDIADMMMEQKDRLEKQRKEIATLQEKETMRTLNSSCTTTEQDSVLSFHGDDEDDEEEESVPGIQYSPTIITTTTTAAAAVNTTYRLSSWLNPPLLNYATWNPFRSATSSTVDA